MRVLPRDNENALCTFFPVFEPWRTIELPASAKSPFGRREKTLHGIKLNFYIAVKASTILIELAEEAGVSFTFRLAE